MTTVSPRPGRVPSLEEHATDPVVEHILFATDGGEAGAGAMTWLADRARMHRLDLAVLTVVEQDWLAVVASGEEARDVAEQVVSSAQEYLARTAPSAEVTTGIEWGDAREVVAVASESQDLLVVGTNRTTALASMLGSSFSIKLVEASRCPVLVVPKNWKPGHGAVVVGIQGDGSDDAALRFAVHEARVLHRELRVVHCWPVPALLASRRRLGKDELEGTIARDDVLESTVQTLRGANPDLAVHGVLARGEPAEVLTREARGEEILVVGSHGYTVMDRFFIGSVSREILTRPPCPVAVVRPDTVEP
jgi:nucleotide-binding universal stress UspA family protein